MERIEGISLREFLRREIQEPLGMSRSYLGWGTLPPRANRVPSAFTRGGGTSPGTSTATTGATLVFPGAAYTLR